MLQGLCADFSAATQRGRAPRSLPRVVLRRASTSAGCNLLHPRKVLLVARQLLRGFIRRTPLVKLLPVRTVKKTPVVIPTQRTSIPSNKGAHSKRWQRTKTGSAAKPRPSYPPPVLLCVDGGGNGTNGSAFFKLLCMTSELAVVLRLDDRSCTLAPARVPIGSPPNFFHKFA